MNNPTKKAIKNKRLPILFFLLMMTAGSLSTQAMAGEPSGTTLVFRESVEENIMLVRNVEAEPGDIITIEIEIVNDSEFVGFNLYLLLPEGFSYLENTAQLFRADDHDYGFVINEDTNTALIIAFSLTNSPFLGNEGVIFSLDVEAPAEAGEYLFALSNAVIGNAQMQDVLTGTEDGVVDLLEAETFALTLLADPPAGGVLSGGGNHHPGETVAVNATANSGYSFLQWSDNVGDVISEEPSFLFTMPDYDAVLVAEFAINTYIITATVGANGSITPAGAVVVGHGTNQSFIITPDEGYQIADILVDGESAAVVSEYVFENVAGDHTIHVEFAISTYIITASAGRNGSISPAGSIILEHGDDQVFFIAADESFYIADVLVDGVSVGAVSEYVFEGVTGDHTIHAEFAINTYIITATAGANGSISPSGAVMVEHGDNQGFIITAEDGHYIADVLVDGESVGAVPEYVFEGVTGDHTIHAEFAINTHIITATAGANGNISPSGAVIVEHGDDQGFIITADEGHYIADVVVDGESVGAVSEYVFEGVTGDHTIHAEFAISTYIIMTTAGANGSISPFGNIMVEHGEDQGFSITADIGYQVGDVLVDGVSVGAVSEYVFEGVSADHTIHAEFVIAVYIITASTGANGSISPAGNIMAEYGDDQVFIITPDEGFGIANVQVDGESVGAVSEYVFEGVTGDHAIHAEFAISTYIITATAGANGNISPSGAVMVEHGDDQGFIITVDDGHYIADVLVDGESVGAVSEYVFEGVSGDHTIHAEFAISTYIITATAGANGSISPFGNIMLAHGDDQVFYITPKEGHYIADVLVDGVSVGAVSEYVFQYVAGDHTIHAEFAISTYIITATAGANGSISPPGAVMVEHGDNQGFIITADDGHYIADVLVDGVSVGAVSEYVFEGVSGDHTIHAEFAAAEDPADDLRIARDENMFLDGVACFFTLSNILVAGEGYAFIVEDGGEATLASADRIRLLPGTMVESGGYLLAFITDESPCGRPFAQEKMPAKDETITSINVVDEANDGLFINLYPNPAERDITIGLGNFDEVLPVRIEIFSLMGNRVLSKELPAQPAVSLDLTDMQAGMYVLRVVQGDKTVVERFIKR